MEKSEDEILPGQLLINAYHDVIFVVAAWAGNCPQYPQDLMHHGLFVFRNNEFPSTYKCKNRYCDDFLPAMPGQETAWSSETR